MATAAADKVKEIHAQVQKKFSGSTVEGLAGYKRTVMF